MKKTNHWGAIRVGKSEDEKNHADFHFQIEAERIDSRELTRRLYEEFLKEMYLKSSRESSKSRKIKSFCFK